jgi:ribonuclease HI
MGEFVCRSCSNTFTIDTAVLARYPGWEPSQCLACRDRERARKPQPAPVSNGGSRSGQLLTLAEVLERFEGGPSSGVFTDGGASPNPGPGGWGAVYVTNGEIIEQRWGHDKETTNNRMELTAIIAGCDMVPAGRPATIYSDSHLAVRSLTEWAPGWEKNGWKRKTGPIKNLELVKEAYYKLGARPELHLEWIKAHDGSRWNEYADALANTWRRED